MKHTAESRQQADGEYAAYVTEAYRALARWCQGQRKIPTGFETFSTGVEAGIAWERQQTPLQGAALAALVAWRKADLALTPAHRLKDWDQKINALHDTEQKLRVAADVLIAAEGGTG